MAMWNFPFSQQGGRLDIFTPLRIRLTGLMAVYTDVTDEALDAFLADYDLGTAISFKGIAEGVENSNFFLATDRGRFILTLYEKRVRTDQLPFFLGLMEHLAAKGFPCPLPVEGRDGIALRSLENRAAVIVTFLDGLAVNRPQVQHCRQLGAALARLHLAGAGYAGQRENGLGPRQWEAMWPSLRAKAEDLAPGLGDEGDAVLEAVRANWPKALKTGVIHADLFPDNVFFMESGFSAAIDFYFACVDFLAYDVAVCLNAWCFEIDGGYNLTKGQALIAGYRSVRPIPAEEISAMPLLARGAAFRFFLTRLADWGPVEHGAIVRPKDPMEYARKMAFHARATGPADYGA
jgi:homoserine kinase type II